VHFQEITHSFAQRRTTYPFTFKNLHTLFVTTGVGGYQRTSLRREATGHAGACPVNDFDYAPAPFEKLPTASASVLYTSNTVRSFVICSTS